MTSDHMPAAVGPYSMGKIVKFGGNLLGYSSGHIGLDPRTNELVSGDVAEQTEQIIKNIMALARDNGFTLDNTVKNTVYLVDMADFDKVNAVYKKYYQSEYPARTCIAIKALPKGALVEIEAIFFKPRDPIDPTVRKA